MQMSSNTEMSDVHYMKATLHQHRVIPDVSVCNRLRGNGIVYSSTSILSFNPQVISKSRDIQNLCVQWGVCWTREVAGEGPDP